MGLERHLKSRLRGGRVDLGLPKLRGRLVGLVAALRGARVLDVGAGQGELVSRLLEFGADARGVDPCVTGGGRVLRARAEALPFRDGTFDVAVSSLVLHYLPAPAVALGEIRRVLGTGGRLVLADRIASENPLLNQLQDRIERYRNPYVAGLSTPRRIGALLRGAGFRVKHVLDHEEPLALEAWLAGLPPGPTRRLREAVAAVPGADLGGLRVGDGAVHQRVRIWVARVR